MRLVILGGVAGPALFALVVLVAAALRPGYSHVASFISELGADGTAHAALMNWAGFVPAGLAIAAFGRGLATTLPAGRRVAAAAALLVAFGSGIAASGVVSCDAGCPQTTGSIENLVHNRIGALAFMSAIAAIALLAVEFRRAPAWRRLATYSGLSAAAAAGFLVAMARTLESRETTGLWQRLLLATLFSWCGVVAVHGFRLGATGRPASRVG